MLNSYVLHDITNNVMKLPFIIGRPKQTDFYFTFFFTEKDTFGLLVVIECFKISTLLDWYEVREKYEYTYININHEYKNKTKVEGRRW